MKTPRALKMQSSFLGRFSPHFAISTLRVVRYSRPRVLPALDFRVSHTVVPYIFVSSFFFFLLLHQSRYAISPTHKKENFSLDVFPGGRTTRRGGPVRETPPRAEARDGGTTAAQRRESDVDVDDDKK